MIVILILYTIIIFLFLFILTNKSTPVFDQKENIILKNINDMITEEESKLTILNSNLRSTEEYYHAVHDLTSSSEFNKYKQQKLIDPYTVLKFTYDLVDRWHLL
ncbi:CNPV191 conserved hypothetical protein [Canarypox virus]|uniref:Uncharacterized protein CNPV191 n=1 Tax=Canarypox virus TaxID=44088 RepID=Q6VZF6_CNPV|nr:CNPV191 conserved hypothetical protein [Canarypox virus]AAR83537.1 CNPV191 conserved hypothetical protein [Canarypox virus]AWD84667.1 hypothetical protein CNPV191 [Canarypox virus]